MFWGIPGKPNSPTEQATIPQSCPKIEETWPKLCATGLPGMSYSAAAQASAGQREVLLARLPDLSRDRGLEGVDEVLGNKGSS